MLFVAILKCFFMWSDFEVVSAQIYQSFIHGHSGDILVPNLRDIDAPSFMQCARECNTEYCKAFYFYKASGRCKHMIYNYIDKPFEIDTEMYEFFYKNEVPYPVSLPWIHCPLTSESNFAAVTSTLQVRLTLGQYSHSQAVDGCEMAGEKLLKIATVEKQTEVLNILGLCSAVLSHDYWIEGKRDVTGHWRYVDGSDVPLDTSDLWHETNSYNATGSDCVRMQAQHAHRWNDFRCESESFGYICESI